MPSESQINCYFCSVALNIASCRGDGMARSFFCKSIARALALFLVCGLWNKTSRSIRPKGFFHSRGWGESNPEMTPLIRNQRLHCSQVEHPYGLCYLPFYSNHGSPWVRSRWPGAAGQGPGHEDFGAAEAPLPCARGPGVGRPGVGGTEVEEVDEVGGHAMSKKWCFHTEKCQPQKIMEDDGCLNLNLLASVWIQKPVSVEESTSVGFAHAAWILSHLCEGFCSWSHLFGAGGFRFLLQFHSSISTPLSIREAQVFSLVCSTSLQVTARATCQRAQIPRQRRLLPWPRWQMTALPWEGANWVVKLEITPQTHTHARQIDRWIG